MELKSWNILESVFFHHRFQVVRIIYPDLCITAVGAAIPGDRDGFEGGRRFRAAQHGWRLDIPWEADNFLRTAFWAL